MAETAITNEADTIIDEVVATLLAGTISAVSIFDKVEKTNSIDWFKGARLQSQGSTAIAGVVNVGIEEFVLTDDRVGNVLSLTIFIATQEEPDTQRVTDINKLVSAVKNLLNGDKPSTSTGFIQTDDGEMTPRIAWGVPAYDSDKKPWVFAELPIEIAYVTTNDTSH